MRLIAPHIRRAVLFGRVIEFKKMEAATLADALDGISAGMLLADATSHIVHANAAAHAILEKRDVLRTSAGRLFIKIRKPSKFWLTRSRMRGMAMRRLGSRPSRCPSMRVTGNAT